METHNRNIIDTFGKELRYQVVDSSTINIYVGRVKKYYEINNSIIFIDIQKTNNNNMAKKLESIEKLYTEFLKKIINKYNKKMVLNNTEVNFIIDFYNEIMYRS